MTGAPLNPGPEGASADPAQRRRIRAPRVGFFGRLRAIVVSRDFQVWGESLAMTALAPAIGHLVQPQDPFFLTNGFSWLAAPPIVVALRHGFGPGVSSALLLVVAVAVSRGRDRMGALSSLPSELLFGVVLLAMTVGQVSASLARRFSKVETEYRHLRKQFDGFVRSYMLLELSHERLEQRVVKGLSPLRAALAALHGIDFTSGSAETPTLDDAAGKMLDILAMYGRVQAASVHAVVPAARRGGRATIDPTPLARVGECPELLPDDELLATAVATGDIAYAARRAGDAEAGPRTQLLAAIPLIEAGGERVGVVAVHALPFVALEESNLRLLAVVAGYVADVVRPSGGLETAHGEGETHFTRKLERAGVEAKSGRTPAAAMAFWCKKGERASEVLESLVASDLRVSDTPLLKRDRAGNPVLAIVMPLTDRDGTRAFLTRVDRLARERLGDGITALGVRTGTWVLSDEMTAARVLAEIEKATEAHEGASLDSFAT